MVVATCIKDCFLKLLLVEILVLWVEDIVEGMRSAMTVCSVRIIKRAHQPKFVISKDEIH
jgi:hypothetical protein